MNINRKLLFSIASIVVGTALAAAVIALVVKSGSSYFKKLQDSEIKNKIAVEDTLLRVQSVLEAGSDSSPCFKMMQSIENKTMLPEQQLKYNILWGDLYIIRYRESTQDKVRQIFFNRAVKQYNIAIQMAPSPEIRGSLYRRNAALHMEAGQWKEALTLFQSAYPLIANPGERWNMDLAMARCYLKNQQPEQALFQLDKAAGSDNYDVWAAAVLAKADIFLRAIRDSALRDLLARTLVSKDRTMTAAIANKQVVAYCENKASELYHSVEAKIPKISRLYAEAQLGLLRLAVIKNDGPESYRLANRLMSGPAIKEDKVKAIIFLVELEESRGRYQEAIALVKKALEKYPMEASRLNAGLLLYNLYKKIKNWDAAFSIARNLFQESSDPDAICKLIQDFSSGKNMIFDIIVNSSDKEYYIKQLLAIFSTMESSHPAEWRAIEVNAYYVLAQLYFACSDYVNAANTVNKCFLHSEHPETIDEKILRLDLMCALKSKASPAIVICRARRYLDRYPRGDYYREALLNLLRNYSIVGLYSPALQVARKIYADELDTFSEQQSGKKNDELWMETIAMISECYYRLGEFDKAAKLLRSFSRQLMNESYGAKVYYTWAMMAIDRQQLEEALRRLSVALMYTNDDVVKLKLQVAQSLLLMNSGSLKDFYDGADLVRRVESNSELSPVQKEDFKRKLLEAMLDYAMKNGMNKEFDLLLGALMKKDSSRLWCQYWVLKALTPAFQSDSLQSLNRKHEEILKSEYLKIINDKWTYEFIRDQLVLIRELIGIETRMEQLKNKG